MTSHLRNGHAGGRYDHHKAYPTCEQERMSIHKTVRFLFAVTLVAFLMACSTVRSSHPGPTPDGSRQEGALLTPIEELAEVTLAPGERLRVVTTTNILADVIANVGADSIEISSLVPLGADPHSFVPTPSDIRLMSAAHVVILNGVGLEEFMTTTLRQIEGETAIVSLSQALALRSFETAASNELDDGDVAHEHGSHDPHVWFDPLNVMRWVDNAAHALSALDPANAAAFQQNAQTYKDQLVALDAWIQEQVASIPPERRKLVTDHIALGYFASRYDFELVGAVVPAYSTAAEPSASELAALIDALVHLDVPAIFVGANANPTLAQRAGEETGVILVTLYTGSLSEPGGPADTYLRLMQYDVSAISQALGVE